MTRQTGAAIGGWLVLLLSVPTTTHAQAGLSPRASEHWVTTWATAQQLAPTQLPFGRGEPVQPPPAARVPATLKDQTVRMIAHASLGGRRVRVALSNALEKPTLRVGAAHVALRANGAAIVSATDHPLTFGGRTSTNVPPGTMVVSDPVDLAVPALTDVAVSLYLPEDTGMPTVHPDGMHTAYIAPGDATAAATLTASATTTAYLWLASVDVLAPANAASVVAFGDSITDGVGAHARQQSRVDVVARGKARSRAHGPRVRHRQRRLVRESSAAAGLWRQRARAFRSRRPRSRRRALDDRAPRHQRHHVPGRARRGADRGGDRRRSDLGIPTDHRAGPSSRDQGGGRDDHASGRRQYVYRCRGGDPAGGESMDPVERRHSTRSSTSTRLFAIRPTPVDCVPASIRGITCIRTTPATPRWPPPLTCLSSGDRQGHRPTCEPSTQTDGWNGRRVVPSSCCVRGRLRSIEASEASAARSG